MPRPKRTASDVWEEIHRHAILKLVGTGTEHGFQPLGESEADPRSRYAIRGTLIAEVVGKTIYREDAETLKCHHRQTADQLAGATPTSEWRGWQDQNGCRHQL